MPEIRLNPSVIKMISGNNDIIIAVNSSTILNTNESKYTVKKSEINPSARNIKSVISKFANIVRLFWRKSLLILICPLKVLIYATPTIRFATALLLMITKNLLIDTPVKIIDSVKNEIP